MALDLEKIDRINREHEKKYSGKGDQIELTEEDERILDEVWKKHAKENGIERVPEGTFTIPDAE